MKLIRFILGRAILTGNALFVPQGVKRDPERQQQLDQKAKALSLYQLEACPFCVKVRRELKRQSIDIELRDIKRNDSYRSELLMGGGRTMVPCLRIEEGDQVRWMYESSDIVAYLRQEFG